MIAQLKNKSARKWITALERDGFKPRKSKGSHHIYQHPDGRRVLIVFHKPSDTFGPKTIKQLLTATGWGEAVLRHLGLTG